MSEQKVVICKDLKSELQDFLSSLKYDKLFILMDTNTKEKCFPLVEDIPAFQKAPILVMEAGDMNKGFFPFYDKKTGYMLYLLCFISSK